ncbi:gamma-glutamylcyclotransferase family protein [Desulfopila sp. IMCC35006]|uniref:gamma-glutamylcyclotransferase family protein n=1 Tax=Desulfopila sp. IMCC35006 TaxID=2569542 RepID=UPI0021050DF4|nr:gamma-glutamylcyclotransferase family protein [Desulfopila sp. IMCC35006]
MIHLFTYGSLMCSDIMYRVAGCKTGFTQASLYNFFRSKIAGREYPGIIPQQGAMVPGVLYFDISAEALERLDIFEGEMYQRQEVEVINDTHDSVTAMTYIIKPQYRGLLTDKEWSFSEFLAVGKEKFEESYFGFQEI